MPVLKCFCWKNLSRHVEKGSIARSFGMEDHSMIQDAIEATAMPCYAYVQKTIFI